MLGLKRELLRHWHRQLDSLYTWLDIIHKLGLIRRFVITIFAPMIYTAPCVIFLMRADTFRGQVGGGWALEMESFLGPVKWHRADRLVPLGAKKTREFQGPTPSYLPT